MAGPGTDPRIGVFDYPEPNENHAFRSVRRGRGLDSPIHDTKKAHLSRLDGLIRPG